MGPVIVLAIAAILVWRPAEPAVSTEELASLSGPHLSGSLMVNDQLRVGVSLEPLHEDARRQGFDGEALAKRLGLGRGEPWRLKLVADGDAPLAELSDVHVLEDGRECLSPLVDEMTSFKGGVQDPLIGLFQLRSGQGEGREWELVLWGDAPTSDGQLQCSWGSASLSLVATEEDSSDSVVRGRGEASDESASDESDSQE